MAPPFTLRTLGVPQLLAATGESVRFRTRKHFALVIRLGVESGRPLTRDHLIELLWGEAPQHLGRHSLAQAITVLKAKLGRSNVLIHKSTVALAPGVVEPDVAGLDSNEGEVRGRFLEGFEIPTARAFEEWRDAWHAKLLPRLRDFLVRQMDAGRRIGDFATVERHAEVLAELDPLSEDALRGIMEARAWVGDRTNALKAYAQFEAQLAHELGARPSPELARIANLLREGRRSPYRQPSEPPPEAGEKRFEPERLVGREREFGQLYDAWIGVRRRQPCVMVVTGDPGIGKTTLTNAFVSTCQMEGAVVARAQAYDAERELPFAVLAELVRQLTIQRAIGSADPEALSELSRICGDVLTAFPGVPKPVEWSAEITPLRLAGAFLKTITAAAVENSLVLVVDDVHAADNASGAILHLVARKLVAMRLCLILVARTGELRGSGAPEMLVTDSSIGSLHRLELEPLCHEAAERLIRILSAEHSRPLQRSVAMRILTAANGNPLALELLIREWESHGATSLLRDLDRLDTIPAATLGIPRAIRAVFDRQALRLDRRTRATLDVAAVLGRRITELSLYEAGGLSTTDAAEGLARLCDQGFLREVHGEVEFRNELLRAQAYYAITPVVRHHLHLRVAQVLAARTYDTSDARMLQVAWHFLRGGDWPRGLELGMAGAEAALVVGAPNEAEQMLSALLRNPRGDADHPALSITLARALLDQSKANAAVPILDALRKRADLPTRSVAQIARMRASATYLVGADGTDDQYSNAASEALGAARDAGDSELLVKALFEYARSGVEMGDQSRITTARTELLRAHGSLSETDHPFLLYALAYCHYFSSDIPSAADCIQRSIALLKGSPDVILLSLAYNGLGIARQRLCDLEAATASFEAGLRVAERVGDDSRASIVSSNLCTTRMFLGDFDAAIGHGERSIALGKAAFVQPLLGAAFMNLADAYLLKGNLPKVHDNVRAAIAWLSENGSWRAKVLFLLDHAGVELGLGNQARALQILSESEALIGQRRAVAEPGTYCRFKTYLTAYLHDDAKAQDVVNEGLTRFKDRDPLAYVDALAASAWLERRVTGTVSESVEQELALFYQRVPGKMALLGAQGFLAHSGAVACGRQPEPVGEQDFKGGTGRA